MVYHAVSLTHFSTGLLVSAFTLRRAIKCSHNWSLCARSWGLSSSGKASDRLSSSSSCSSREYTWEERGGEGRGGEERGGEGRGGEERGGEGKGRGREGRGGEGKKGREVHVSYNNLILLYSTMLETSRVPSPQH